MFEIRVCICHFETKKNYIQIIAKKNLLQTKDEKKNERKKNQIAFCASHFVV